MAVVDHTKDTHKGYVSAMQEKTQEHKHTMDLGSGTLYVGKTEGGGMVAIGKVEVTEVKVTTSALTIQSEEDVLTDEYLELKSKLDSIEATKIIKRMDEIKAKLQSIANEQIAPDTTAIFHTDHGEIIFSARKNTRVVSDPAKMLSLLIGKVGLTAAAEVVKVSFSDLDKIFLPLEQEGFVSTDFGSRSLLGAKMAGDTDGGSHSVV